MRKKTIFALLLSLAVVTTAAGCSGEAALSRRGNELTGVKEVLEKRMREENPNAEDNTLTQEEDFEADITGQSNTGSNENADNTYEVWNDPEFGESTYEVWNDPEFGESTYEVWNDPEFDESQIPITDRKGADGIDVDLTKLSANMVYAEVFYMMTVPENYVGKTVRMEGLFATYRDETTNKMYYACIIQDATACCAQGMEFVTADERSYPEDYPAEGDGICVVGVFDTYEENGETYAVIKDSELTKTS